MPEISKPNYSQIWASGGAVVAPSSVKIQTGWTAEVPPFQWENWSQNRQDSFIAHINQHGLPVWDSTTEYQYSLSGTKSIVMGSNGSVYQAKQVNTNQDPVTDVSNVYWTPAFATFADVYTKAQVDAKTTIATSPQAQAFTNNTTLLTPLRLADAFGGANFSGNTVGYQRLPNGLIYQWMRVFNPGAGGLVTYPTTWTQGPISIVVSVETAAFSGAFSVAVEQFSVTQLKINQVGTPPSGWWANILAIGK